MLLLVALLSLAQPETQAAAPGSGPPAIVILGDDARRGRVERALGELAAAGRAHRRELESGMWYAGCVSAWRDNAAQAEACVRSRLLRQRARPTVVLNTHAREAGPGRTAISCIGLGGTGQASLRDPVETGNAEAMRRCLDRASRATQGPWPRPYPVRFADRFEIDDVERARAGATRILKVAIDHLGIPRGMTGTCLVQGRVTATERGEAVLPGGAIEIGVPCGPTLSWDRSRRVRMAGMGQGNFARVYLDDRRTLLHIEPATE